MSFFSDLHSNRASRNSAAASAWTALKVTLTTLDSSNLFFLRQRRDLMIRATDHPGRYN
jgi:hypothetical protein